MDFNNFSSADWQSFIFYLVMTVTIASGLFLRRELALNKIFKYLGIWTLIVLVLVIAYSYRHNFSDLKDRFSAEINPAAAQINKHGQIVINISRDGHFYVDAKINNQFIRFMVDTGASDIALNYFDARKIGINPENLSYNKRYQTANGTALGAGVNLEKLEIGEIIFNNLPASVGSNNMGVSLLGMSFLSKLEKYEFYQDQLILTTKH